MRIILSLLSLLTLLFACKSTTFTPKNYTGQQLIAGSRGGVTGMMKEYALFDNGQVFLSKGINGSWKEMKTLKKSKTREIFNKADELGISTLKINHPGNMTYYLIMKDPSRSNEIKWGESGFTPPEGVTAFYNYLMSIY